MNKEQIPVRFNVGDLIETENETLYVITEVAKNQKSILELFILVIGKVERNLLYGDKLFEFHRRRWHRNLIVSRFRNGIWKRHYPLEKKK